jgi:hypothetical protein
LSAASTTLSVRLNKPQSAAIRRVEPGNTVCLRFGRGVGKTKFQRLAWYSLIARWDGINRGHGIHGIRIVLLTPTFKQAIDTYAALIASELAHEWGFLGGVINKTRWRIDFPGGSWIQFFGAENAESARGLRCDVASLDECDDIDYGVFDAIVTPWFSEPWSLKIKIASGTPKRGRHGLLYKLWKAGNDGLADHYSFHSTYKEVPENVSSAYVESVRSTMNPSTFKREWDADFDSAEGLVYAMFSLDIHVREPDYGVPYDEILVGVDHGWNDPGVFLVGGVIGHGRDAIVHWLEEVWAKERDTSWWGDKASDVAWRYRHYRQRWYADPSRPDRIVDLRKAVRAKHPELAERFSIEPGENEIEAGVDAVADRMMPRETESGERTARMYFSPKCVETLAELGKYRRKRDPKDQERILDDIVDANNHCCDAARYPIMTRFGGPGRMRHEVSSASQPSHQVRFT